MGFTTKAVVFYLLTISCAIGVRAEPGDSDNDGDRDTIDLRTLTECLTASPGTECIKADFDSKITFVPPRRIDLRDFAFIQNEVVQNNYSPGLAALESLTDCLAGPKAEAQTFCDFAAFDKFPSSYAQMSFIDMRDVGSLQNNYSPWVRVVSTSPSSGEAGVALNRETIINLSGKIDPASVTPDSFFAVFGGERIAGRLAPTPDGQRIKLFYDPTLPASARVRVTLNGETLRDQSGFRIDADRNGQPGGTSIIDFDTCSVGRIPNTNVEGYVIASEPKPNCTPGPNEPPGIPGLCDVPLQGVVIRVDGFPPDSGPCNPSNPNHFCAVTDANGRFLLQNTPAPALFVQIDGSTVTSVGGQPPSTECTYPKVGKPFHSVAGYTTPLIMDGIPFKVHLPCVADDTLQTIDPQSDSTRCMTATGQVAFQHLYPGSDASKFCITVPANSLTFDDGTSGTQIGMFPVASTRLPAPLSPGMVHAFDITIQTDGATNFEIPAPICFPNVPDPATNQVPLPGDKLALASFNHDTGKWEIRGSMTVQPDGESVCTDVGVGVIAPGWHGQLPGSPGSGNGGGGCNDGNCCSSCEDGLFCNGRESCANGKCIPGTPPCKGLACDEATDICQACSSDQDCSDLRFCNGAEVCADGKCQDGVPPCDEGQAPCNEITNKCGCNDDYECDDGLFCNGQEVCIEGNCEHLNFSEPCPGQNCNEGSDSCGPCTSDFDCDDGDACNGSEYCPTGGVGANNCQLGDPLQCLTLCDPQLGCIACISNRDCDNNIFCDGRELCDEHECTSGEPPCEKDRCMESARSCRECLVDSECDNFRFCDGEESCAANGKCISAGQPCPESQPCNEKEQRCGECDFLSIASKVASLIQSGVSLAAEFFPAIQAAKCIIGVIADTASIAAEARELATRESVACSLLGALKLKLQRLVNTIVNCVDTINVVSRLKTVCDRAQAFLNTVQGLGDLVACLSGSPLLARIQAVVNKVNEYLNIAFLMKAKLAGLINPRDYVLQLAQTIIQQIDAIACENTAGGSDKIVRIDPAMRAALIDLADALDAQVAAANAVQVNELLNTERVLAMGNMELGSVGLEVGNLWLSELPQGAFLYIKAGETVLREKTSGNFNVTLPANATITVRLYDPINKGIGEARLQTSQAGSPTYISGLVLVAFELTDSDFDALSDEAEMIVGTDPSDPDTDGDGVPDGAELEQGSDPLDGRPVATGIIATSDTPGIAVDVCAVNDVAMLADSDRGVTVFNVTNGQAPVAIAQVDTPGSALAVSCSGNLIAVADGTEGLQIIDITDPPAARIVRQIPTRELGGGSVQAVATVGDLAFVGTTRSGNNGGRVSMVELPTGVVLQRFDMGGTVQDIAVEGSAIYVFANGKLTVMPLIQGFFLQTAGSVNVPGSINSNHGRGRLFVGGGVAYAVVTNGYHTFNVSNPSSPTLIAAASTQQAGWKGIALNGSGLGIAAVGPNPSPSPQTDEVYLFNTSNPSQTNQFVTLFQTPGIARAVSLYNGLAYIADHASGLQVINYLAYDALGQAPTGIMTTSAQGGTLSEGERVFFRANVGDDVQVRNVEFFVNGQRAVLDGNFPFEFAFRAPPGSRGQAFAVTGIARDTGGNVLNLGPINLTAVADEQPPLAVINQPADQATYFRKDVIKVRLTATDNVGVASVAFKLDGAPFILRRLAIDEWELDAPTALGLHTLVASATDTAGNTGSSANLRFFVRDQAISRLFTVFNDRVTPVRQTDAVSRLFTVFHDQTPPVEFRDVVSKLFTVFHDRVDPAITDLSSRMFTVMNRPEEDCSLFVPQSYTEDFEDGAGAEWSIATTDNTALNPFTRFSGRFSSNTQTLVVNTAPGLGAELLFDLYIIDTWDGHCGSSAGPDHFAVLVDGRTMFHHTFVSSAVLSCQSFGLPPTIGPAQLGFGTTNDSVYRNIRVPIITLDDELDVAFWGLNLQGVTDESWGIDNVRIRYTDQNSNNIPDGCE